MAKIKTSGEIRDALMYYLIYVLELEDEKLGTVGRFVYSPGFLKDLKKIREELSDQEESLFSLETLKGVKPSQENTDVLGIKIAELINRYINQRFDSGDIN